MDAVFGASVRGGVEYEADRDTVRRFSDEGHGRPCADAQKEPGLRAFAGLFCRRRGKRGSVSPAGSLAAAGSSAAGGGKGQAGPSGLRGRSEGGVLPCGRRQGLSEPVFWRHGKPSRAPDLPEGAFPDGGAVRHPAGNSGLRSASRLSDDAACAEAGGGDGPPSAAGAASSCPCGFRDGGARAGALHRRGL